jgi:TonB family protein
MTFQGSCCSLWLSVALLAAPALADNACAGLNTLEVAAALHGPGTINSIHVEVPDKKISYCYYKRAEGGPFANGSALRSATGPNITFIISDPGGPSVLDPKTMDSEQPVPSLGDRATVTSGPFDKSPGSPLSYRVTVLKGAQSYMLIYVPSAAGQQPRDTAIQLAREVLLVRFGFLDSHPIAEQILTSDKAAVLQKPDNVDLWNEIGLFSDSLKRYDEAHDAYLKISQLVPDDPGGYYGIAMTAWQRSYPERMQRGSKLGFPPLDDAVLNPKYKDFCEDFKKDFQSIIDEGYDSAKKALQMHPESGDYATYMSYMAREKAATDCEDAATFKTHTSEADHFAQVLADNRKAETSSGKKYTSRIEVAPFLEMPPPPPQPGEAPMGGVIGAVLSTVPTQEQKLDRVRVSSGVSSGLLIKKVPPIYPELARQARIQGTVILEAIIDHDGNVVSLKLVSGHPMLAPAAIEAVKQWKYRPYLFNGKPVSVDTQMQVNFELR